MSKYREQIEDFIAAGFHRLDNHILAVNAPKIQWGEIYKKWPDAHKVQHLEKLAATMNHAAALIQDERNKLNKLLEAKEKQIVSMKQALEQNNDMIQTQVTSLNAERQRFNASFAKVNAEVRELRRAAASG